MHLHNAKQLQRLPDGGGLGGHLPVSVIPVATDEEPDRTALIEQRLPQAILWLQELAIARKLAQDAREAAP